MNILYYLRNPFHSTEIIDIRLAVFAQYVLDALIEKNIGGIYDSLINSLTTALANFYGNVTGESTDLAVQKGKTLLVNNIVKQFEKKVHHDYSVITASFYKDTPEFLEFFPHGLSEYNNIRRSDFDIIIIRLIAAITAHQVGGINAQMLTDYNTLKTNFHSALAAQTGKKTDVKTDKIEGNTSRVPLENQLYFTIHTLAASFSSNPEKVKEFFDTSLLYGHTHHKEELIVTLQGAEAKDSGLVNIVGLTARFNRISGGKVQIFTSPAKDNFTPGSEAIILDQDKPLEIKLDLLGAHDNQFLILLNLESGLAAQVGIELSGIPK